MTEKKPSPVHFITKKTLPRRTFLRGAGSVLGLPLLSAMTPALSRAQSSAATGSTTRFRLRS